MMMAEVGDMEKVSGNKMATPFAPPNPGRTPISTPSKIPTNINRTFWNVRATANPCIKLFMSSTALSPLVIGIAILALIMNFNWVSEH